MPREFEGDCDPIIVFIFTELERCKLPRRRWFCSLWIKSSSSSTFGWKSVVFIRTPPTLLCTGHQHLYFMPGIFFFFLMPGILSQKFSSGPQLLGSQAPIFLDLQFILIKKEISSRKAHWMCCWINRFFFFWTCHSGH